MKSVALDPVPTLVVAEMRPDEAAEGTVNVSAVVDPMLALAATPFKATVVADVLKFVPVTETLVLDAPLAGVNPVMVGAPGTTVKLVPLMPVDPPTVTLMGPVVAPVGTAAVIEVALDALTVAVVPLNLTVLFAGVALNPTPEIVTTVPSGPLVGLNEVTATVDALGRETFVMLPAGS